MTAGPSDHLDSYEDDDEEEECPKPKKRIDFSVSSDDSDNEGDE